MLGLFSKIIKIDSHVNYDNIKKYYTNINLKEKFDTFTINDLIITKVQGEPKTLIILPKQTK